jgi:hypothetical protein
MVKPFRVFALALALVAAFTLAPVPVVRAADVPPTCDVGAARAARVLLRRALPWILAIIEELLEQLPPGTPPPQPPPVGPSIAEPELIP